MSENIRYAWGQSSLGDFITAISPEGCSSLRVYGTGNEALATLRARFSEAAMEPDEAGLSMS
jgi:AraC family transcriptional regulator of adaptative response/methylated-DNA-[protein]-cysteine methyltransferase